MAFAFTPGIVVFSSWWTCQQTPFLQEKNYSCYCYTDVLWTVLSSGLNNLQLIFTTTKEFVLYFGRKQTPPFTVFIKRYGSSPCKPVQESSELRRFDALSCISGIFTLLCTLNIFSTKKKLSFVLTILCLASSYFAILQKEQLSNIFVLQLQLSLSCGLFVYCPLSAICYFSSCLAVTDLLCYVLYLAD